MLKGRLIMDMNLLGKSVVANCGAMFPETNGTIVEINVDELTFNVLWENDSFESFHLLQLNFERNKGIGVYLNND